MGLRMLCWTQQAASLLPAAGQLGGSSPASCWAAAPTSQGVNLQAPLPLLLLWQCPPAAAAGSAPGCPSAGAGWRPLGEVTTSLC